MNEQSPQNKTPEETLIIQMRQAKTELNKRGEKVTLTNISKILKYKRVTTLDSKIKKYHIKWRKV